MNARTVMPLGLASAPQVAAILQSMSPARGGGVPALNLPPVPHEAQPDPLSRLAQLTQMIERLNALRKSFDYRTPDFNPDARRTTGVLDGVDFSLPHYVQRPTTPEVPVPPLGYLPLSTGPGTNPAQWIGRLLNLG